MKKARCRWCNEIIEVNETINQCPECGHEIQVVLDYPEMMHRLAAYLKQAGVQEISLEVKIHPDYGTYGFMTADRRQEIHKLVNGKWHYVGQVVK